MTGRITKGKMKREDSDSMRSTGIKYFSCNSKKEGLSSINFTCNEYDRRKCKDYDAMSPQNFINSIYDNDNDNENVFFGFN